MTVWVLQDSLFLRYVVVTTNEVCDIPTSQRFELSVPVGRAPDTALAGKAAELEPNAMAHFKKMSARRTGAS